MADHPALTGLAACHPADALVQRWLAALAHERRASVHTVDAYGRVTRQFLTFLGQHWGRPVGPDDLATVSLTDLRAFLVRRRQGREPLLRGLLSMLHPRTVFRAFDPADMGPPVQMTLDWLLGKLRGSGRWVWSRLGPGAA